MFKINSLVDTNMLISHCFIAVLFIMQFYSQWKVKHKTWEKHFSHRQNWDFRHYQNISVNTSHPVTVAVSIRKKRLWICERLCWFQSTSWVSHLLGGGLQFGGELVSQLFQLLTEERLLLLQREPLSVKLQLHLLQKPNARTTRLNKRCSMFDAGSLKETFFSTTAAFEHRMATYSWEVKEFKWFRSKPFL